MTALNRTTYLPRLSALVPLSFLPPLLLFAGAAGIALPVQAQTTLYSNFGAGSTYATNNSYVQTGNAYFAFQFNPTVSGTVGSLSAALFNATGSTNVTAEILNNASGLPGSTVLFAAAGITAAYPGGIVTFNSGNGSLLTVGISYWATIIPSATSQNDWYANNLGATGNTAASITNGASYTSDGLMTTAAFSISTAAPEPESLALLALGLTSGLPVAVGMRPRRRGISDQRGGDRREERERTVEAAGDREV